MNDKIECERIAEVLGRREADVTKGMLESEGVNVQLVGGSVSQSSSAVPFANVQVFVPKDKAQQARDLTRASTSVIEPDESDED